MYYMETYTRLNYKVASWRCHRDLNGGSSLLRIFLLCVCRVIHESRDSTLGITRKTAQRVCLFPPRAKAHMHVLLCVYLPLVAVFFVAAQIRLGNIPCESERGARKSSYERLRVDVDAGLCIYVYILQSPLSRHGARKYRWMKDSVHLFYIILMYSA